MKDMSAVIVVHAYGGKRDETIRVYLEGLLRLTIGSFPAPTRKRHVGLAYDSWALISPQCANNREESPDVLTSSGYES